MISARKARMASFGRPSPSSRAMRSRIERSLADRDRKGCLLVNSALDVAPHDAEIGKVVAGYLDEIRAFFWRNIEAGRNAGQIPRSLDADAVSTHLLGVLLGLRVLARTMPDRALLEGVVRPALGLLDMPIKPRTRRRRP